MDKAGIFISHIAEERALAEILKRHLRTDFLELVDVFVSSDINSIGAGERWLRAIDSALERAKVELVLCSHASIREPWINFETGAGWTRRIPTVPICHSGLRLGDLPMPMNVLEAIEAGQLDGIRKLYGLIARVIGSQIPNIDYHKIELEVRDFEASYRPVVGAKDQLIHRRIPDADVLTRGSTKYLHAIADGALSVVDQRHRYMQELRRLVTNREIIPTKYWYWTELGSRRWLEICERESYRYYRNSLAFLSKNITKIIKATIDALGTAEIDLISLGSGDGKKDNLILRSVGKNLSDGQHAYYYPIDISDSMIVQAIRTSVSQLPREKIKLKAMIADFTQMRELQRVIEDRPNPNLFSILGNTVGNNDEILMMDAITDGMLPGDLVLIEINVDKTEAGEQFLYDDITMRTDFVPLEVLGVSYDPTLMVHFGLSEQSIVPNTHTSVSSYKRAVIEGVEIENLQLALVHHYELEEFRSVMERKMNVKTLLAIERDGVGLLLAQREV